MKNHFIFLALFISSVISTAILFANNEASAQTNPVNQTVAITTTIDPITILTNELMSLLDTSAIGNLTSLTVTTNLPCDSSNVPKVKIIAGILGNTTNVIDSSTDYTNNKGPRDTCVFTDKITNVTAKGIPAMNRVFLKNTGSTAVHIPEGVMVTLTGIFGTPAVKQLTPTDFQDDFTTNAGWTQVGTGLTVNSGVVGKLASVGAESTNAQLTKSLGLTLNDGLWSASWKHKMTVCTGADDDDVMLFGFSAGTGYMSTSNQDALGVYFDCNFNLFYKDGADALSATFEFSPTLSTEYCLKLQRTSTTNLRLNVYESTCTTHQGTSPFNLAIPSTVTTLTTVQASTRDSNGGITSNQIDDLSVKDNS